MKSLLFIFSLIFTFSFFNSAYGELSKQDLEEIRKIVKEELHYMDKINQVRFEQIDKRFEQIDKRFEQIDKRFEEVHKRIDMLITFLWILSGIFTALLVVCIGLVFWDRKTFIQKAKEETLKEIEKEGKLADFIRALREVAKVNKDLQEILKKYNLL